MSLGTTHCLMCMPIQVKLNIFKYLSTGMLLKCRLVSKHCKDVCSRLCRSREVRLNMDKCYFPDMRETIRFLQSLKDAPWSTIILESDRPLHAKVNFLLERYGSTLRKVSIIGSDVNTQLDFLSHVPLVRSLKLLLPATDPTKYYITQRELVARRLSYVGDTSNTVAYNSLADRHLRLERLQKLNLYFVGPSSQALLEYILTKTGCKLQEIHLSCYNSASEQAATLAKTIKKIPSISLELTYDSPSNDIMQVFLDQKIQLNKLMLNLHVPTTRDTSFYSLLEMFLAYNANSLEKLTLRRCRNANEELNNSANTHFEILNIPPMLNLKHFGFYGPEGDMTNCEQYGFQVLTGFPRNHFPTLRKVKLVDAVHIYAFKYYSKPSLPELVVDSIRDENLDLGKWDWGLLFPEIKRYSGRLCIKSMLYIFDSMPELEYLDATIEIPQYHEDDVDPVFRELYNINYFLTRVRYAETVATLPENEIKKWLKTVRFHDPCLKRLNKLKFLKFTFIKKYHHPSMVTTRLNDGGVILSLLLMPPLDTLILKNVDLSLECELQLRARHKDVTIQDNFYEDPDSRQFSPIE